MSDLTGTPKASLRDRLETERVGPAQVEVLDPDAPAPKLEAQIERSSSRVRAKSYVLDLRIHSPGSLGYLGIDGIDTAPALIRLARVKGLDVIAVTDFYSGAFIDRCRAAAVDSSVTVIPGVVVRCILGGCRDVILSCLFPEDFSTAQIERFLAQLSVPRSEFGNRHYLLKPSFDQIVAVVEAFGGRIIPSRMDKTPHRQGALGDLVEQHGFRTFDLAYTDSAALFKRRWPKVKFNLFSFSSAYALAQVGSRIAKVKMTSPGFAGILNITERAEHAALR